jgi:hypothetical protein
MTQPIYFTDPERLAETVIARVGKTVVLGLPLGIGKANHVANALYARAVADPSIKLRIFTALTLEKPHPRQDLERRFMAPVAERLFAGYPELEYGSAQRAGRLPANIEVNEFFFLAGSRLHSPSAQQSYVSANYRMRFAMRSTTASTSLLSWSQSARARPGRGSASAQIPISASNCYSCGAPARLTF